MNAAVFGRPIDTVLARLDRVSVTKPGCWKARCPAHADASPSLSIREMSDGRLLLRDFAGCTSLQIVTALGLHLRDLFLPTQVERIDRSRLTEDPKRAVDFEVQRLRDLEVEEIGYQPPRLTRHVAAARERVGRITGRTFAPIVARWWEVEPGCSDPLWTTFIARVVEERALQCDVTDDEIFAAASSRPTVAFALVDAAAAMLHECARTEAAS